MVSPFECIAGKPVTKRLKDKLEDMDNSIKASYPHMGDAERAKHLYDALEEDLKLHERNILRLYEVQQRVSQTIAGKDPKDQIRVLMNTLEGSEDRRAANFLSVAGARSVERAIMDGYIAEMYQEFTRRVWTPGTTRGKGLQKNIAREAFGQSTKDPVAKRMKDGLRKMEAYVVNTMKAYGARVHYDPERQFIVQHDRKAIGSVSKEDWIADILPRLDLSKMINRDTKLAYTEADILPVLGEIYDSIRTNGTHDLIPGKRSYLAAWQRSDQSRFFIWKDFDAWAGYNERFGFGEDYFGAIVRYVDRMSRDLALFRVLGPDWDATNRMMEDMVKKAANAADPSSAKGAITRYQRAYDIASGKMGVAENQWLAEVGSSSRNIIQSAFLGSTAILQLVGDTGLQSMARSMNGLSEVRQIPQFLKAVNSFLFKGSKGNSAQLALRLGLPIQSVQHSILGSMRAMGEFDGHKWSHMIADTNFRLSGLTLITDAQQAAFGTEFVLSLTENLGKRFQDFPDQSLATTLNIYGINEAQWLKLSEKAPTFLNNGTNYLDLLTLARDVDYENGSKLIQMINTEMDARAVQARTPATARRLTQGTNPGSVGGEIVRFGTNLLSFPVTYIFTQLLGRMNSPGASKMTKAAWLAQLVISMSVLGAVATYANDVLSGRDPAPMDSPDFWMKALAAGGGFGIFGDWIFREHYGKADLFSVGPAFGIASEALLIPIANAQKAIKGEETTIGRDTVSLARKITPFSSLWYAKAAWDRIVFDQLQKWADPQATQSFNQQVKSSHKNKGQDYWWAPGQTSPSRPPNFEGIIP